MEVLFVPGNGITDASPDVQSIGIETSPYGDMEAVCFLIIYLQINSDFFRNSSNFYGW
ncbi:MAG TPA: hypothetical protein VNE00_12205 [Paraburkholderia sp.]|nr:hypothetical protein [Paraburkholderia sp.]